MELVFHNYQIHVCTKMNFWEFGAIILTTQQQKFKQNLLYIIQQEYGAKAIKLFDGALFNCY